MALWLGHIVPGPAGRVAVFSAVDGRAARDDQRRDARVHCDLAARRAISFGRFSLRWMSFGTVALNAFGTILLRL